MNTLKLIELVKKHQLLYDISHLDYKNVTKKDIIWEEIGNELNESGELLKKKWKGLRDTYTKYLRYSRTDTTHRKKWVWADRMKAFRPFLFNDKISSTERDTTSPETNPVEFIQFDAESTNSPIESITTPVDEKFTTVLEMSPQHFHETSSTPPLTDLEISVVQPKVTKSKKRKFETEITPAEQSFEHRTIRNGTEYDEIDGLFLAHAKCVKKMSHKRQIITKFKIAEVIMEQEMLNMEELSASTATQILNAENIPEIEVEDE